MHRKLIFTHQRLIAFLSIVIVLCLTACAVNPPLPTNSKYTPSTDNKDTKTFEWYHTLDSFNSGLACVSCSISNSPENNDGFYGFVNKNGDLVFKVTNGARALGDQFDNGFFYVQEEGTLYVIDTEGNIRSKYASYDKVSAGGTSYYVYGSEENTVCSYGYGYVIFKEHIKDFSTSKYKYTLYSPDNEALYEYETTNSEPIGAYYTGCGVFAFNLEEDDQESTILYFTESKTTLILDTTSTIKFVNGYTIIDEKKIIDAKGSITEIDYSKYNNKVNEYIYKYDSTGDYSFGHEMSYIDNEYILYYSSSFYRDHDNDTVYYHPWFSYNYVTDKLYVYDNQEILSKVDWELAEYDNGLGFQDGVLVLPLKGADEETYFTMINTKMEEIVPPTMVKSLDVNLHSGLLQTSHNNDVFYYKTDGTIAFKLSDTGYQNKFKFSDGAMLVYNKNDIDSDTVDSYFGEEFAYIDTSGKVLFTQINKTTAKELILN